MHKQILNKYSKLIGDLQGVTLEYLITVQLLLNIHNEKLDFIWQFDVVELMINDQFKTFSINLNVQHVNGMTPFD